MATVLVVAVSGCSGGSESGDRPAGPSGAAEPVTVGTLVELRPLHVDQQRIVDDAGRQVLLRGANLNALGDYHRADPGVEPTAPVTDDDWSKMAANGFSVVRLIMSWSRLEPERGRIDRRYLSVIRKAVEAANAHGIYVVLDMHQDAWGKSSATPAEATCPAGTDPVIGWDGAPAWATITDGATTCLAPGEQREAAPAVRHAFANFYADTDGIADRLTAVWVAVAEEFSGVAGVAGYDLLNEPNAVDPLEQNQVAYSQWLQRTIDAIRAAEEHSNAASRLVFAEPLQLYPLPDNALLPQALHDPNLVFAPHNYAESITPILTVEQTFAVDQSGADELDAALWIGEYGIWDTSPKSLDVMTRYAAEEDRRALGGAWWQWRQTCGDPHSVAGPGLPASSDQVHLITRTCPGHDDPRNDTDLRDTAEFLRILGRAYPRAAPGRVTRLVSAPGTGAVTITGTGAAVGAHLVVWLPTVPGVSGSAPSTTAGLDHVRAHPVRGGRILTATTTSADYTLVVG